MALFCVIGPKGDFKRQASLAKIPLLYRAARLDGALATAPALDSLDSSWPDGLREPQLSCDSARKKYGKSVNPMQEGRLKWQLGSG